MSKKNTATNPAASDSALQVKNFPASLCRRHQSQYDGSEFMSISFRYQDRWASVIIDEDSLEPSLRRNGEELPDRFNIVLGDPDEIRNVSLSSEDGESYVNQPMYNRTILDSILSSRREFRKSLAV